MKKILLSLFIVSLLFTVTGCLGKEKIVKKENDSKKIYGVVEEYSSMDDTTKKYSDYKYDKKTGLIEEYKEQNGAYTTTYKLSYDDNQNLIKKEEISKDTLTATYTYNSDNTISKLSYTSTNPSNIDHGKVFEYRDYKKDDKDRVISYSTYNITRDNYKMDYTFKYDNKDRVIEETQTTDKSSYTIKYKYDKNDNKIEAKTYKGNSTYSAFYKTYKYKVIGKYKK